MPPSDDEMSASVTGTFIAALTFFTRIPRPPWSEFREGDDRHAAAMAPYVGILVGLGCASVALATASALPPLLAALLAMAFVTWLTGALHEDGLADFADGFGLMRPRERTLAIMRDPSTGVFAVLSLVFAVGIKVSALAALISVASAAQLCGYLITVHALSRLVAIAFMAVMDYARADDANARGARLSNRLGGRWMLLAAVGGLAPLAALAVLNDWRFGLLAVAALVLFLLLKRWFHIRLQGYTGDCLGAAQQLCELLLLIGLVAIAGAA